MPRLGIIGVQNDFEKKSELRAYVRLYIGTSTKYFLDLVYLLLVQWSEELLEGDTLDSHVSPHH